MASSLWFIYALAAAILWGASYAISEELVQRRGVPPSFLILIELLVAIPFCIFLAQTLGSFKVGLVAMFQSTSTILLTVSMGLFFIIGNALILYSVSLKSATMAGLIEISYPLFTVLFVWMFFGKFDLNMSTALGAAMIIAGVSLIYLKA